MIDHLDDTMRLFTLPYIKSCHGALKRPHKSVGGRFYATKTSSFPPVFHHFHRFSTASMIDHDDVLGATNHIHLREYQNIWSTGEGPFYLASITDDPRLDRQSRHVLELLQTMYQTGLTKTLDRITTERCNTMILKLSQVDNKKDVPTLDDLDEEDGTDASQPPHSQPLTTTPTEYWHRCERARAILESMELFSSLRKDVGRLPVALPTPTHDTYFQVLRMYGSKRLLRGRERTDSVLEAPPLPLQAPLLAQAIVERMTASGELALLPSAMHWNQVLSAYANSSRPKRQLEAATLLYELDQKDGTDESSFSHVLRCCGDPFGASAGAVSTKQQQRAQEKSAEVSIAVAQRVWKGLKLKVEKVGAVASKNSAGGNDPLAGILEEVVEAPSSPDGTVQMQSYHFVHMMRVARNFGHLASLDTESSKERQEEWIRTTLQECIQYQKVNIHVLLEVVHQSREIAERGGDDHDELNMILKMMPQGGNDNLQRALEGFRGKRKQAVSRSPGRIAKELLRQIPDDWTRQAES
jgi:hypothetical protein